MGAFKKWLGRKVIAWDPWNIKEIREEEWLRGRNNGIRIERSRIIKLLESELGIGVTIQQTLDRDKTIEFLITLIKGIK